MQVRTALGLTWSLVLGLAGGWLVLSPWSLGQQGGGDWTMVTRSEVGAGLGLILLALIGLVLLLADVAGSLRAAGVIRARQPRAQAPGRTTSPEMEKALLELAQTLARDLEQQRSPRQQPAGEPSDGPGFAVWREQQ